MDKKTKLVFKIGLVLILLVIIATYYKVFIRHDYLVDIEVPCDPNLEYCFIGECDSESDNTCINNSYNYKIIETKAYSAIPCADGDFDCLSCKESEENCEMIDCDPEIGDTCTTGIQ